MYIETFIYIYLIPYVRCYLLLLINLYKKKDEALSSVKPLLVFSLMVGSGVTCITCKLVNNRVANRFIEL